MNIHAWNFRYSMLYAQKVADEAKKMKMLAKERGPVLVISPRPYRQSKVFLKAHTIRALFHLTQKDAAKHLGISLTTLKSACKRLGVKKWNRKKERKPKSKYHHKKRTIPRIKWMRSQDIFDVPKKEAPAHEDPDWLWKELCGAEEVDPLSGGIIEKYMAWQLGDSTK
eukprot:666943-Hanusia_phi.AAC.4